MRLFETPQIEYTSDDYYTPKWIFDTLGLVFDLDVAAPPNGAPFVPCKQFYTQAQDGLTSEWFGSVWMNPPFSAPSKWVAKFIEHAQGVAIVGTSCGRWLNTLWNSDAMFAALDYVSFWTPNGPMKTPIPIRCWLVGFGELETKALKNFSKIR